MTALEEKASTSNPMAATWTKAALVRRAFKAGPPRRKDLVLAPTRAMFEGCILLNGLQVAMRDAGLSEKDVQAALILMSPPGGDADLVNILPIPETKRLPELYAKVKKLEAEGWLPLGAAIKQIDREAYDPKDPKSGAVMWVQPWLTNPRATRALFAARAAFGEGSETATFN